MPFLDLLQLHFVAADITAVDTAITTLENTISPKSRNLTPEERQRYGSVNEQNKLLINKVRDYRQAQPGLSTSDVTGRSSSWTIKTGCSSKRASTGCCPSSRL